MFGCQELFLLLKMQSWDRIFKMLWILLGTHQDLGVRRDWMGGTSDEIPPRNVLGNSGMCERQNEGQAGSPCPKGAFEVAPAEPNRGRGFRPRVTGLGEVEADHADVGHFLDG